MSALLPQTPEEAHAEAIERGAKCRECPLWGCGQGPVMGIIKPNSRLIVIAEAPGGTEVDLGEPLRGASGRFMNQALDAGGTPREETSLTNVCLCRPPGDGNMEEYLEQQRAQAKRQGKDAVLPTDCCFPRLQRDLEEANSVVEYAMGKQALKALARHHNVPYGGAVKVDAGQLRFASLRKQHGAPVIVRDGAPPPPFQQEIEVEANWGGRKVVIASYHPAYGFRGAKAWLPVIGKVITRAARIASNDGKLDWFEPAYNLDPTLAQIKDFAERAIAGGHRVMVDIETGMSAPGANDGANVQLCKLRTVGWGVWVGDPGSGPEAYEVMQVPVHDMAGEPCWSPEDMAQVEHWIREVMDRCDLAFQHGAFDTAVLLRLGLMSDRRKIWYDCYLDSKTEFMTRRGWLKYADVEETDELATINERGELEWQRYFHRVSKKFTGHVYDFETQRTRCIVTGNHRMRTRPVWRSDGRKGDWDFTPAIDLIEGSPDLCETYRAFTPVEKHGLMTIEDAVLMGLYASEGSIRYYRGDPYGVRLSQKVGGRAEGLMNSLHGFNKWYCVHDDPWRSEPCEEGVWGRTDPKMAAKLVRECGRTSKDKRLPSYVFDQSVEVRQALLDALIAGDGHEGRAPTRIYFSYSRRLADDVQFLALTLGQPATIGRSGKGWAVFIRPDLDQFERMGPRIRRGKQPRRAYAHVRKRKVDDRIVCFSVPNETLVTRVGGKVAMQGNTLLAHHDTDSNDLPHDLGFIISEHFDAPHHKDDADHKSVDNVDFPRLKLYGARDVYSQMRCAEALTDRIRKLNTWAQFRTDTNLAPVCRDMGDLGLVVLEDQRQALARELTERVEFFRHQVQYEAAILDAATRAPNRAQSARTMRQHILDSNLPGMEKRDLVIRLFRETAEQWGYDELNPRAYQQLQDLLFVKHGLPPQLNTKGYEYVEDNWDDPSTSTAAILKLLEKHPGIQDFADALLEFRAYDKLYGTYVADKRGLIRDVDWTVWGMPHRPDLRLLNMVYKLHVIPSGRMSVTPNIQAWPAVGKANMRTMIGSPPGHCIVGADYDQLELRIYAAIAQDQMLLRAFAEGLDPHSMNAATLMVEHESQVMDAYRKIVDSPPKFKKYWRTVAKRFCYLETYGGEEEKLFATMSASRDKTTGKRDFPNLTIEEVQAWHNRWHRLHPETKRWQQACRFMAHEMGYTATHVIDHRHRHFPGGIDKKNAPMNHTVQGNAASIANKALLQLADAIPHRGWSPVSGPVLQVHDYIGCYVPRERIQDALHTVKECMEYDFMGIRLTCDPQASRLWSDQG